MVFERPLALFELHHPLLQLLQSGVSLELLPYGLDAIGDSATLCVHKQIFGRTGLTGICVHRGSQGRSLVLVALRDSSDQATLTLTTSSRTCETVSVHTL